jgi:hypothetical protein
MWQRWSIPHTLSTWLQLNFTCSLHWNQPWSDGAFVMLRTLRMRRKSWNGFHKIASRNVSNTFTVAERSVYLHKGTVLKEMYLTWFYPFIFPRNKVIPGTLWSYHVRCKRGSCCKYMTSNTIYTAAAATLSDRARLWLWSVLCICAHNLAQ